MAVDVLVVGAGAFGVSTALSLARRGRSVALMDPGPLPHPEASSTDISKIVRMDYGSDRFYASLAEEAMVRWREWNEQMDRPLYHEVGFLLPTFAPFTPGGFERESAEVLREMGYDVERLDGAAIHARFPQWPEGLFGDGYFNTVAGWAESGAAVGQVLRWAVEAGVELREGVSFGRPMLEGDRCVGIVDREGMSHSAGHVVVAAGAWTPVLLPWMAEVMQVVGQPVFHLKPSDPELFRADVFPVWAADISNTGWYGFPANADGLVKIADHGAGIPLDPEGPKVVPESYDQALRAFLRDHLPGLADAPVVARRFCMYCDTPDGDFWIDRDTRHAGLTVAAGGSGHGFKFMPVLGDIVADVVDGLDNPWLHRFRARVPDTGKAEHARYPGDVFADLD